jgi:recombination protein RecA
MLRRTGAIKKGDEVLGNETRVKVLKNKVAPPFKQAEFQILYNQGISRESEIIELGVAQDLIEKAGAWYSVDGERIGQGKDNARDYLKENTQLRESLESKIREKLMQGATDTVE